MPVIVARDPSGWRMFHDDPDGGGDGIACSEDQDGEDDEGEEGGEEGEEAPDGTGALVVAPAARSRTGSLPSNQSRAGCTHSIATAAATSADIRPPEVRPATNRIGASTLSTTRALREACSTTPSWPAVAGCQPSDSRAHWID
mgnify:CR=1 FL=1